MSDQRKLVFSSVGDNSDAWESWLDGRRDYEIAIVYYGDDTRRVEVMQQNAEYFFRHKGAKFQNFERYREQFDHDSPDPFCVTSSFFPLSPDPFR